MMDSLVSVVVPCYNHEEYIEDCIKSIIGQDYQNIELVVIDDGSHDNSFQKIENLAVACRSRFKRFEYRTRKNIGLSSTLNEALQWCEGEYISIIASDDLMLPHKTSMQVDYLNNNPKCGAVFSGAKILSSNGSVSVTRPAKSRIYWFDDIILNKYSLFTPSQLIRKKAIDKAGGYKDGIILEDWYIYLKITNLGFSLDSIPGVLVGYRRHNANISRNYALLHNDRLRILSLYKDNRLYSKAYSEFLYTKGRDLIPYRKVKAIGVLVVLFIRRPIFILRLNTFIAMIKLVVPKSLLLKRINGE